MSQTDVGIRVVVLGAAQASRILGNVRDDLSRFANETANQANAVEKFGRSIVRTGDALSSLGRTMTYIITTPIAGAIAALTNAGIQFEDAFAGVSKTVEGVAVGFNEVAESMYGTSKGLSQTQKDAVFASGAIGELTEDGRALRDDFIKLSREIPVTASELAAIGQVAGQLGVRGREQLLDFVDTMAKLGVATDLSAEQAAFAIARMGNIMGIETENMGQFAKEYGNTVVALGNTTAATESEITNLAYRIAGAGRAVGLSMQEVLGLSASLAAAGIKAEMGGSAVSKILTTLSFAVNNFNQSSEVFSQQTAAMEQSLSALQQSIASGAGIDDLRAQFSDLDLSGVESDLRSVANGTMSMGQVMEGVRTRTITGLQGDMAEAQGQLRLFARATGMTEQALASLIRSDPTRAFQLVLQGIAQMQEAGTLTNDTLTEMELNTIRLKDVILRLGPNMDLVTTSVNTANEAWTEQIALEEEAAKRFKTMKSMIQLARNALTDLGITIFDLVKDDLANFVKGIGLAVDGFKALDPAIQKTIIRIGLLVSTIGPLLLIGGTLLQLTGNGVIGFGMLNAAIGKLIPSFDLFGKKQKDITKSKGIFSTIFGKVTGGISGTFGNLSKTFSKLGTELGGFFISAFIGPIKLGIPNILKAFNSMFGGVTKLVKDGFLAMKGLAGFWVKTFQIAIKNGFLAMKGLAGFWIKTIQNALSPILTIASTFLKSVGMVFNLFTSIITVPIQIISKTFTSVVGTFGKLFTSVFSGLIGIIGQLGGKLLSLIPVFGKFLFSGILGTFTKLPLIIGGALALLFAPKVIGAAIKNRDALFAELKLGFTQFRDDIKNLGLEKSIMLFFGGGSTGSGRRGGIYGIAKALGASEDSAKKFAYAMGTAAYWVIKIAKDTKNLVNRMAAIATASDRIGSSTSSTGNRLTSFAAGIAKFLEGFSVGWLNSFDDIIGAFTVFVAEVKKAVGSVGSLFDAIFGGAKAAGTEVDTFFSDLEPGAENTASHIGMTIGNVIGGLLTLTIQALTFITSIAGVVANALTGIVTAYNEGGIVGVFEELGPLLAGIFNGFIAAAGTLWTSIEPSVSSFLDTFTQWMINTGAPALWAGAKSMFGVIRDALDAALFGTEEVVQEVVTGYRFEFKTGAYAGEAPLDYMNDIRSPFATNPDQFNREEVFGNQIIPAKEGLIAKIGRLIDDIQAYLTSEETKSKLRSAFQTVLGAAGDVFSYLWEGGEGFEGLHSYLSDLADNVSEWFISDGAPRFRAGGAYIWQEFKQGLIDAATGPLGVDSLPLGLGKFLENGIEEVTNLDRSYEDFLNDELNSISIDTTSLASSAGISGSNIGKSITDGVRASIVAEQENVNTTVDTLATSMISTTKGRLAIKSPSRVFYDIGKNVISGLVIALKETGGLSIAMNNVVSMFSIMGNGIISALAPVKSELTNFITTASNMLTSINSVAASLTSISSILTPTTQQMNTLLLATNSLLGSLGGISTVIGSMSTVAPAGAAISNVTYNNNNYSPSISGSSINPVKANDQMFNSWLVSQGKFG